MSIRRRAMAIIGARLDDDPLVDRAVLPGPRHYDEDAADRHQEVGGHFEVNASELWPVVAEVRAGYASIEKPPGFQPLPFDVLVEIVRQMGRARPYADDMPDLVLRFRANGTKLPADDFFGEHEDDLAPGTYLTVQPTRFQPEYPAYSPRTPASEMRRSNEGVLHGCEIADALLVAEWFVGPLGRYRGVLVQRCWKVGDPWPEALDGGVEPKPLDPSVIRRVVRAVREECEHPGPTVAERPWLIFDVAPETPNSPAGQGECSGPWYPQTDRFRGRPREHYLRVRLPMRPDGKPDDDPSRLEELEALVARETVAPDGRVIYPPVGPVDGPADAFATT